ncbi:MAG TPA: dTDP-4-dehydrorhamnose reductase [Chloroflexota bacterium]
MRVLITGGEGQLAGDLMRSFHEHDVLALGRAELDVTQPASIDSVVTLSAPDVIVNTAAFHRVDLCESEPEQSFLVNAAAPQRLARWCAEHGSVLVHFSTDYVFDGRKGRPYTEDDPIAPLSVYGTSKSAGEMAIRATTDRHLIVRTTGVYGVAGVGTPHGNFVETMLRLAGKGAPVSVVADQILTPTYARDLAEAVVRLVEGQVTGTVHVTGSGECSWYDFAAEIFRLAGVATPIVPTTQGERPVPAARPAYSVLAHERLRSLGIPEPLPWKLGLAAYMAERAERVSAAPA